MAQYSGKRAGLVHKIKSAARRMDFQPDYVELTVRDSEVFATALIEPQPVNQRLQDTVRLYRQKCGC